ncbi:MAG: hypothetical protein M1817_005575 [Caeruleum heppii]|nr:MAG: hypothetical protein M1817_005575 [Caeruleum heppii]
MIPTIPSPGADKGEMESHLRAMLDSVRQIQAHNPSMFSQVWEQVKKGPKADNASPLTVNDRRPVAEGIGQPPPIASTRSTHDAEDNGRFESLGVRMSDINPQDPSFGVAPADTLLTVSSPAPRVSVESSPSMATVQPPNASAHQTVQVSTDPQVINALLTKPSSSGSPAPMGQTIWPELSKPFLATAAVEQLKEDPENADLSITTQHVKAILDRNLSYVHLCLILEQQGFKFDRKIFANALLGAASGPHMARNTPAIGGQQEHLTTQDQAQRPMTSTNRPQISKLPSSESPAVPDLSNGQSHALAREASGTTTSRRPTDSADVKIATTVAGDSGVASRQSPTATGQAAPQTHFPVQPTSKAQAAHKRTFAEIVDLTEEVSDFAEPAKVTQKNDDGTKGVMTSLAGRSGLNTAYPTLEPSGVPSHKSSTSTNGVHPPSYDAARSKTAQLRQMDIIKSLPSKSAKKRPTKVLRTVAEDVLIASGRHPQKRGLNDHLQPLKKFIAVSNSSDLGSFRWASVDPNAKPARTRRQSATAPTKPDCNPNFKYPPRPPTQPITGGYSDMIAFMHRVSAVQTTPKPSINGSSSALKTPDRILPSQDEESLRTSTSAVRALETSGTKASLTTSLKEDGQARFEGQRHASSLERPLPTDQRSPPKKSFSHEVKASTPRRRNSPSVPPVRKLASPVVVVQGSRSAQTKPIARTSRSSSPDMPPISIHSGSPQADGARSGLGRSSSFAIVIASPSSSQQRDRRLPPRQVMDNRGSANLLAGIFLAQHKAPKPRWWAGKTYHCEWKDCQAKLHNMDTLRRHIKKQHQSRPEHEMHVCRWAGCGEPPTPKTKVDQQATEEQHHARTFGTADALKDHIEQSHLDAYLWKHGEGPRVTTSREARDIAKHLNDSEGRMVTPNALKPESQDAQRLVPAGYRPTLAWLKAHGYRTREEKGQALLEHLKARRIGPEPNIGIFMQGFGGRLVTRERRRALKVEKGIATAVWPELESGI